MYCYDTFRTPYADVEVIFVIKTSLLLHFGFKQDGFLTPLLKIFQLCHKIIASRNCFLEFSFWKFFRMTSKIFPLNKDFLDLILQFFVDWRVVHCLKYWGTLSSGAWFISALHALPVIAFYLTPINKVTNNDVFNFNCDSECAPN